MRTLLLSGLILLTGVFSVLNQGHCAGNAALPASPGAPPAVPGPSLANRADVNAFIQEMAAKHGFDAGELRALFNRAQVQPEILALMSRPAEAKPWHAYRKIFLTPQRIQGGTAFWNSHQQALARAAERYNADPQTIVAIIGVETLYGGNTGRFKVLEALATLAFDYPKRAVFFRKELENFLLLTREEGIDPLSLNGSYAGAMGLAQFMPSSYRAYAVDFNGDGHRNLWRDPEDAIGSVANYLSKHGWRRGSLIAMPAQVSGGQYRALVSSGTTKPNHSIQQLSQSGVIPQFPVDAGTLAMLVELEGNYGPEYWLGFNNFFVITRYNRSALYAMAVYQLGEAIRLQR